MVPDNEPPIRQLLEGIEWCDNVFISIVLLVCVTCQRYLEDNWRFDELMRDMKGRVDVEKYCDISPETM